MNNTKESFEGVISYSYLFLFLKASLEKNSVLKAHIKQYETILEKLYGKNAIYPVRYLSVASPYSDAEINKYLYVSNDPFEDFSTKFCDISEISKPNSFYAGTNAITGRNSNIVEHRLATKKETKDFYNCWGDDSLIFNQIDSISTFKPSIKISYIHLLEDWKSVNIENIIILTNV